MHSTCCIQILTRSGNQAHITELLRRNEEDHTNPLKHLLEPVLLLVLQWSWCWLPPAPRDICPSRPAAFHAGLQQSTWWGVNCTTFHPEHWEIAPLGEAILGLVTCSHTQMHNSFHRCARMWKRSGSLDWRHWVRKSSLPKPNFLHPSSKIMKSMKQDDFTVEGQNAVCHFTVKSDF